MGRGRFCLLFDEEEKGKRKWRCVPCGILTSRRGAKPFWGFHLSHASFNAWQSNALTLNNNWSFATQNEFRFARLQQLDFECRSRR